MYNYVRAVDTSILLHRGKYLYLYLVIGELLKRAAVRSMVEIESNCPAKSFLLFLAVYFETVLPP